MMQAPDTHELPTLTEVLIPGHMTGTAQGGDLLGPVTLDVQALEARLLEQLVQHLRASLEQRVHASVVPAVSLLADRIAYKAAQEVASDLADRMRDDLQEAVRQAVDEVLKAR